MPRLTSLSILTSMVLLAAPLAAQEPAEATPLKTTLDLLDKKLPAADIRYSDAQLRKAMVGHKTQMPNTSFGEGLLPPDAAKRVFDQSGGAEMASRVAWVQQTQHWTPAGLWHHPLYFEDVMVERHGHSRGPWIQPWISGGRFFGTLPALAYKWQLDPPRTRFSTLGHYRPGSPAPLVWQRPRWRWDAAAAEALTVTGLIFTLP